MKHEFNIHLEQRQKWPKPFSFSLRGSSICYWSELCDSIYYQNIKVSSSEYIFSLLVGLRGAVEPELVMEVELSS